MFLSIATALFLSLSAPASAHPPDCGDGSSALHDTLHQVDDVVSGSASAPKGLRPSTGASGPNTDRDGDGVKNKDDKFPNNYLEQSDRDGDGVGDKGDAFPDDKKESRDSDGDGIGDNADDKFDKSVTRKVNYRWTDGTYGGTAKFEITSTGEGKYKVKVKVQLGGERGDWEKKWKEAAEKIWSTGGLVLDVEFVKSGGDSVVRVKKGKGRSNAAVWHSEDDGLTAAHEIAHLLGLTDEYPDPRDAQ